jgi:thiol-disulfide isomerase/thioredoxin
MKLRTLIIAALAAFAAVGYGQEARSNAEDMVAAIQAVKRPALDASKRGDAAYMADFQKQLAEANAQRSKLIHDFYIAYPQHPMAAGLALERFSSMLRPPIRPEDLDAAIKELDAARQLEGSPDLKKHATFYRAQYGMMRGTTDAEKLASVELFVGAYREDPRSVGLLANVADTMRSTDSKVELYRRIVREFPDSPGSKYIPGKIKQIDGLNKPFELAFTDAITGKPVTMADFRGKVVVIDFWATWCGPCIADLPKVQKMYADLKDQGVEIVSISLDQPEDKGGLKALRDFVAKNPMPWAHYYQGNFWDGEFSKSWGVNAIPAIFLVDQNGILVDVNARANLEGRVRALLAK